MSKLQRILLAGAIVLSVFAILVRSKSSPSYGSVAQGSDYLSTTTPALLTNTLLCTGSGSLSSITVYAPNGGYMLFIDATTTDVNKRANSLGQPTATSSLILTWVPPGAASTTFFYDTQFFRGLIYNSTANVPTSTIAYRCNQ